MFCIRKFFVVVVFFGLIVQVNDCFAGKIYILRMENGKAMKCKNIKEQGSVLLCDADGLLLSIDRSTVSSIVQTDGQLSKMSPQSGPRVGGSSSYSRSKGSSGTQGGGYQTTSSIKNDCSKEWGRDYSMIEYCVKNQTEARDKLRRYSGSIRNDCEKEWGSDYRMVVYCIEKQTKAKRNLDAMRYK